MARATPSLTALLGLLAIAGYQNRDRIAEMLRGSAGDGKSATSDNTSRSPGSLGGLLSGATGAGGVGGLLTSGLKDLLDRFDAAGEKDTADSWVRSGPSKECSAQSLRRALGPETLAELGAHTGLSEDELVSRLCRNLPDAVDKYTPEGRLL
jgi:uncharacterized protein YidB (DUF937 family)